MSKKKIEGFSYDAAMIELQKIVAELQNDAIGIDDLSERVSRASELIRSCREKLRQTEDDVKGYIES
jgi:exodeoxyribonuclease VII small subunit